MAMFKRKTPKERTEKGSKNLGAIYAQKTLQPAEEVIYISRFHWIYTLRAIGPLLGAIAVVAIGWALGVIGPFLLVLALPVLFALAHALNKLAYKWVNRVVITNKRLIVQKGWTSRNTMDIGLDRILAQDRRGCLGPSAGLRQVRPGGCRCRRDRASALYGEHHAISHGPHRCQGRGQRDQGRQARG